MPSDKTEKRGESGASSETGSRSAGTKNKAQAEFEKYKGRVGYPAGAMGPIRASFGPPAGFPLGGPAMPGWVYGPPQLAPGSLTERLRCTLRLGADVLNASLAGGLRVLGGLSNVAEWAWSDPRRGSYGYGHDCACGCCDCCSVLSCDCCCQPSVGSCGCGCGCGCGC